MRRPALGAGRHAGVLVPLASMPSSRSWGIGEIPDLVPLARWLRMAGLGFVQLLPVNQMALGQSSPYSAASAMAIDPVYVGLGAVADMAAAGGERVLSADQRRRLAAVRAAETVDFETVRRLKREALAVAFDRFHDEHWRRETPRARRLAAYVAQEAWWLDDYALFRALHDETSTTGRRTWQAWPAALARREHAALADARRRLSRPILMHQYLQWIAAGQWSRARDRMGVGLMGDFPFMVGFDSADVWSRQTEFRLDASIGAPPDAFSDTGQDWGLPAYRWDAQRANGYAWLRRRAQRTAALFDGYRIDHVVGFFRTYVRPHGRGSPYFDPDDEHEQRSQGESVVAICREAGALVIAEDLGVVPEFVRDSLRRLEVPGYRVLRWERDRGAPGQPFLDPRAFPARSVATTGTHDTSTLAGWWAGADRRERALILDLAGRPAGSEPESAFGTPVRDGLLEGLLASGSDLAIVPIQDVFGWADRINVPGTVSADNWTWRLPWPVDTLAVDAEAIERAGWLLDAARRTARWTVDR